MPKNRQNRRGKHPLVDLKDRVRSLEETTSRHENELAAADGALRQMRRANVENKYKEFSSASLEASQVALSFAAIAAVPPTRAQRIARFAGACAFWLWTLFSRALAIGIGLWGGVQLIGS